MSKLAVGYIRVSTEEQAHEGVSLEAQEDCIRAYCLMTRLELVRVIRDEAVTGATLIADRKGGAELLAAIGPDAAAHVAAVRLDRLLRDAGDALTQTRTWDRAGVALHLIDMGGQVMNTSTAMGHMFLTMVAGFAELERNLIAERTKAALAHKKAKGEAVGRAPRGLRIDDTRLAPDAESDGLRLATRAQALRQRGLTFAQPLSANVDETPTLWKFSVEGESGIGDVHGHGDVTDDGRDRGGGEGDPASVHGCREAARVTGSRRVHEARRVGRAAAARGAVLLAPVGVARGATAG
jgi:site-specific DNA recombinase